MSETPWVPKYSNNKSLNNRSSVGHNIISHRDNGMSGVLVVGVLDKKVTNKKKGIAEITDLNHITANKSNPDYCKSLKNNPNQFKRKTGIFSHLYDAAHRFGEDKPFKV